MKSFNVLVAVILMLVIPASFTGCQSMEGLTYEQRVERSIPYLRVSAMIITNGVFAHAVSENDRQEKAKVVYDIAELIESLTVQENIDINSVAEKVSNFVPDKSHWHEMVANLNLIYADLHANAQSLEEGDKSRVLKIALNAIAAGCKVSAKPFLGE
mgnify:CR=1 FL=1